MKNKLFITTLSALALSLSTTLSTLSAQAWVGWQKGDVNLDGAFTVSDIVLMQKWLLGVPDVTLTDPSVADFNEDGQLDVFDLCQMKKAFIEKEYAEEQAQKERAGKTFLDTFYFVTISGTDGYTAFSFGEDGGLTIYRFDEFGDAIDDTIVHTTYEIVENKFSYNSPDGYKRTGTIINPNGIDNFSVQFDDGLYNFNTARPVFKTQTNLLPNLNKTHWYIKTDGHSTKCFEFSDDGISGNYVISADDVTTTNPTKIPFKYQINGDKITFYMGDGSEIKAKLLNLESERPEFAVEWQDGNTEYYDSLDFKTKNRKPVLPDLNETDWWLKTLNGYSNKEFEFFDDGISGNYVILADNVITTAPTTIPFKYHINGDEITFYMGSDRSEVKAKLIDSESERPTFAVEWQNGNTEYYDSYSY